MTTNPLLSRTEIIATLTVVSLVGAAGAWVFGRKVPPKNESFQAIVMDASLTSDPTSRCDDLARLADETAQRSKGVLHLTLFATGDRTSGFEPTRIGTVEFEPGTRLVEGVTADDEKRQQFLENVRKLCPQITNRKESPIFRAVGAAVKTMSPDLCQREGTTCEVVVRTDGIEEEDARVMAALRPARKAHNAAAAATPAPAPRIANDGVGVRFCSLAARQIGRNASKLPNLDAVESAFRREFTAPDRVRFEPACVAYRAAK